MEIKTKYNIGDEVYYITEKGKVANEKIDEISINVAKQYKLFGSPIIKIYINYCINCKYINEEKCFPTKEELLKSLLYGT